MAGDDPRAMKVHPRLRYNTIGGVNGPLVILENVWTTEMTESRNQLALYADSEAVMSRSNSRGSTRLSP